MTTLSLALLADGASDRALLPILLWALRELAPGTRFFEPEFEVRRGKLMAEVERISRELRPDILFVHRDAEREPLDVRLGEIPDRDGVVRVVPVRMTEAWLLTDEIAIRKAAGNPNGKLPLSLPRVGDLEAETNPKAVLRSLLLQASEHTSPRRKKRFQRDLPRAVHQVAEYTKDFSFLRRLSAFAAFERELRTRLGPSA